MSKSLSVEIDPSAGFCFGVANAVRVAEEQLAAYGSLYCLGSLVHNQREVQRLEKLGLKIINRNDLEHLSDTRVLIRAHGEPPETYALALQNRIELIDATCRVVLRLQTRIREDHEAARSAGGQLVIYGKKGHPEVDGLMGQTRGEAVLIEEHSASSLEKIDFSRPITLYCQTTQSLEGYTKLVEAIKQRIEALHFPAGMLQAHDTICRQVSGRGPRLQKFARNHDAVAFVSGRDSSNGKFLFDICQKANARSYFVEGPEDIDSGWFLSAETVGVSGATSTPLWLMELVAEKIRLL